MNTKLFPCPLPELGKELGDSLSPGKVILIAGLQGSGKTILAAQFASTLAMADRRLFFLSTEVPKTQLLNRMLSNFCDWECQGMMRGYPTIKLNNGMAIPDPTVYPNIACKAVELQTRLMEMLSFVRVKDLGFEPYNTVERYLDPLALEGRIPEVLICDYLWPRALPVDELDPWRLREEMRSTAQAFRNIAKQRNILVILFCQADVTLRTKKKILPSDIHDWPELYDSADAFVGISQRIRDEEDMISDGRIYHEIQHFTVLLKGTGTESIIPVKTNFKYQRFESYGKPAVEDCNVSEEGQAPKAAYEIEARSEFSGYVLLRHKILSELFALPNLNSVNLYIFLLLTAGYSGPSIGQCWWSRKAMGTRLGLSPKQMRSAADVLVQSVPVREVGRKNRAIVYFFEDWKKDQDPKQPGYCKLFRNLCGGAFKPGQIVCDQTRTVILGGIG